MKITQRSLVGGAAVLPLTAGEPASAGLDAPRPDSGLLELGVRWSVLCSQFSHLCHRPGGAKDEEVFPIGDQMKEIERAIAVLPASTTMGMMVKVRIAEYCLRDDPFTEKEITEGTTDLWMCRSVMRDLIATFKFGGRTA